MFSCLVVQVGESNCLVIFFFFPWFSLFVWFCPTFRFSEWAVNVSLKVLRLTSYSGLDFDKDLKSYSGEFGVVGVLVSTWPPVPRRSTRLPLLRLKF